MFIYFVDRPNEIPARRSCCIKSARLLRGRRAWNGCLIQVDDGGSVPVCTVAGGSVSCGSAAGDSTVGDSAVCTSVAVASSCASGAGEAEIGGSAAEGEAPRSSAQDGSISLKSEAMRS